MTAAEPPEIRIGDRQRRATDDRLRAALDDGVLTLTEYDERSRQCFAARVQRDLDALVADLPAPDAPEPATPAPAAATSAAPTRQQQPWFHRLGRVVVPIVVLGAVVFGGTRVAGADDGFAVFGSRVVPVAAGQERVEVASLFGSTEVVVPDGTVVAQSGYLVFGSIRCEDACRVPPGAPSQRPVTVDAGGAFGSVQIVTATEAAQGGLRDRDDDD